MNYIKRIVKLVLYPFGPIICLLRDQRPMVKPLSIIKTLYVNFRVLPFSQAIHLPIYVYKNIKIYKLGIIEIRSSEIKSGMISIGPVDYTAHGAGKFFNAGRIIFYGPVEIGGGFIWDNFGLMEFNGHNKIGPGTTFIIREKLEMGAHTTMGFCCFCMDSDDHYTIDVNTLTIGRNKKSIKIGSRNWIASRTFVKKGTITPDYTIVASANTLLSKDYSDIGPYCVLGGIPAKKIGFGIRRIYNVKEQINIDNYFNNNPQENIFIPDITLDEIDDYCTSNFLD